MVVQNPQHTYRKDGIYYYCRRVPKDLLIRYDEERIVMSLRTKSITAARRSAAAITSRLDEYWMSIRIAEMKIPKLVATDAGMIKQHTIKLSDALASYHALKGIGKDVLFFTTSDRFCKYLIDVLGDRHVADYSSSALSLWVDFKPVGKILLTTNNRPEIRGSDDGIWRRIREIPFNRQFTEAEQDKELMTTLTQELPGILNWAIEGCLLWQANGLSAPASVTASVSEYRSEMDTVCMFVSDECTVAAHDRVTVGSLYQQYLTWCRSSGKHPRSKVQFGKALTTQGYEQIRGSTGRYWRGLSISITG